MDWIYEYFENWISGSQCLIRVISIQFISMKWLRKLFFNELKNNNEKVSAPPPTNYNQELFTPLNAAFSSTWWEWVIRHWLPLSCMCMHHGRSPWVYREAPPGSIFDSCDSPGYLYPSTLATALLDWRLPSGVTLQQCENSCSVII